MYVFTHLQFPSNENDPYISNGCLLSGHEDPSKQSPHCEVCSWAEHPHHQLHQFAPSLISSWHHLCSCSRTLWTSCLDLCVFTSSTCCHCISITFVDIHFLLISFTPASSYWITGLYYINLCTY